MSNQDDPEISGSLLPSTELSDQDPEIYYFLPQRLKDLVDKIPESFLAMSEQQLKKLVKLSVAEQRLRIAFWTEYTRQLDRHFANRNRTNPNQIKSTALSVRQICSNLCSEGYFYNQVITNPIKLAYLLCPPPDYKVGMDELLIIAVDRLREIMQLDLWQEKCRCRFACRCTTREKILAHHDPYFYCKCKKQCQCPKEFSPKVGELVLKAAEMVDNRVKGGIVKRIDQRSLNVHRLQNSPVSKEPEVKAEPLEVVQPQDIDNRLKELEEKLQYVPQITKEESPEILVAEFTEPEITSDATSSEARKD